LSADTSLVARSEFSKLYRRDTYLQQQHKAAGQEGAAVELSAFGNSLVLAFQLLTQAGPLCEEPMLGVAFELEAIEVTLEGSSQDAGFSGQVISAAKEAFRVVGRLNHRHFFLLFSSHISSGVFGPTNTVDDSYATL
jgi:translation elongation factor EF-G